MAYLQITSDLQDVLLENDQILKLGNLVIQINNKSYYARDLNPQRPFLLSSEDGTENPNPFCISIEPNEEGKLPAITVAITYLEEYLNIWRHHLNTNTGEYEAIRSLRLAKIIHKKIEATELMPECDNYELAINRANDTDITLAIHPILEEPNWNLTKQELIHQTLNYAINGAVKNALAETTKPLTEIEIGKLLQNAYILIKAVGARNENIKKEAYYIEEQFEQRLRFKLYEKQITEQKEFIIPNFDEAKKKIIRNFGGINIEALDNGSVKARLNSNLLLKDLREQLELDRYVCKFSSNAAKRLEYLIQHCEATVESTKDNRWLITFPKQHLELAKQVTYRWENVEGESVKFSPII